MKCSAAFAIAVAFWSLPAAAQEAPPLTARDVAVPIRDANSTERFYPENAQRHEVEGRASALCVIAGNGDLTNCTATSEAPQGFGFGEATVRLATAMRAASKAKDGSTTIGRQFRFDMIFKLPR